MPKQRAMFNLLGLPLPLPSHPQINPNILSLKASRTQNELFLCLHLHIKIIKIDQISTDIYNIELNLQTVSKSFLKSLQFV